MISARFLPRTAASASRHSGREAEDSLTDCLLGRPHASRILARAMIPWNPFPLCIAARVFQEDREAACMPGPGGTALGVDAMTEDEALETRTTRKAPRDDEPRIDADGHGYCL